MPHFFFALVHMHVVDNATHTSSLCPSDRTRGRGISSCVLWFSVDSIVVIKKKN
jgi:hypothetical protein